MTHVVPLSLSLRGTIGFVMARRRTKKDKIIAQLRRQVHQTSPISKSYALTETSLPVEQISSRPSTSMGKTPDTFLSLFSYDPTFIKKDLFRTAILTILAFSIEFGLYFWRR